MLPHPSDRTAITRELQKELKRVGCYHGEINAVWTPMTRKAIQDFTDRVNASLPIDQPDNILLALVQSHQDLACGRPCPAGQGLSQDGNRCLPNALLAQAAKKARPTVAAAGPNAATVEKAAPTITGWSTTTTAAAPTPPQLPAPEGRMALAGPEVPVLGPEPTAPGASPVHVPARPAARVHERAPARYARSSPSSPSNFVRSILQRTTTTMY